jgi:hypothetical protein
VGLYRQLLRGEIGGFGIWLRMLLSIPLLPANKIGSTFFLLRPEGHIDHMGIYESQIKRLYNYVGTYWLGEVGPEVISVSGAAKRTNSDMESYHAKLRRLVKVAHPNVWKFLSKLNKEKNLMQVGTTYTYIYI